MTTALRVTASMMYGVLLYGALVFLPAGTLNYWQGWVFIAIAMTLTIVSTVCLAVTNPAALQRRMHGGPRAERRLLQKFLIIGVFVSSTGTIALSAFDHRMGWSTVPPWLSVIGDVMVAVGLGFASLVVVQNAYAAATVTVEEGQTLATDGVYGFVRHPMYIGAIMMMLGIPLALGSYWGLAVVVFGVLVFALRILDEEKLLNQQLDGYQRYTQQVRYRLVPHLW